MRGCAEHAGPNCLGNSTLGARVVRDAGLGAQRLNFRRPYRRGLLRPPRAAPSLGTSAGGLPSSSPTCGAADLRLRVRCYVAALSAKPGLIRACSEDLADPALFSAGLILPLQLKTPHKNGSS